MFVGPTERDTRVGSDLWKLPHTLAVFFADLSNLSFTPGAVDPLSEILKDSYRKVEFLPALGALAFFSLK